MKLLKEVETNNIFSGWKPFLDKGYSVIPDKFAGKNPLIKEWSDFCYRLPTEAECISWTSRFEESNIAVCLGQASGIIALDIDEDREEILSIILPILPDSPVKKVGAKGETRFFRYTGEFTDSLKFNGKIVIEVLSNGKKTTIPPSVHPSGVSYKWVDKTLLDVDKRTLPLLPPALLAHIGSVLRSKFPDFAETSSSGNFTYESGRNNALGSECARLIQERVPVDEALRRLIEFDRANHTPPLFDDPEENRHTEPYTNALRFYTNHLHSINTRRFRENKEYEIPITASSVTAHIETLGKSQGQGRNERSQGLSPALTVKKICPCCKKEKR